MKNTGTYDSLRLSEHHVYGSSRLGMVEYVWKRLYPAPGASTKVPVHTGRKRYELTNHLGNVLAVITDRKRGQGTYWNAPTHYLADVIEARNYYPFGMVMPGRKSPSGNSKYRYGFNGKENDDEVKGDDLHQDYGMRVSDPRLGRFLSVDPIAREYPWYTPYQFAGNMPIWAIDLDGLEPDIMYKEASRDMRYGYAVLVTVDRHFTKELTATLALRNIKVGYNIIRPDPLGLGRYKVEQQDFHENSTRNPNTSASWLGFTIIRKPFKPFEPIATLPIKEVDAPEVTINIPRLEISFLNPPPAARSPLVVGRPNRLNAEITITPGGTGAHRNPSMINFNPRNQVNLPGQMSLNQVGRSMKSTESIAANAGTPVNKFEITINIFGGVRTPEATSDLISDYNSLAPQISRWFKNTYNIGAAVTVKARLAPSGTTTSLEVRPITD